MEQNYAIMMVNLTGRANPDLAKPRDRVLCAFARQMFDNPPRRSRLIPQHISRFKPVPQPESPGAPLPDDPSKDKDVEPRMQLGSIVVGNEQQQTAAPPIIEQVITSTFSRGA